MHAQHALVIYIPVVQLGIPHAQLSNNESVYITVRVLAARLSH